MVAARLSLATLSLPGAGDLRSSRLPFALRRHALQRRHGWAFAQGLRLLIGDGSPNGPYGGPFDKHQCNITNYESQGGDANIFGVYKSSPRYYLSRMVESATEKRPRGRPRRSEVENLPEPWAIRLTHEIIARVGAEHARNPRLSKVEIVRQLIEAGMKAKGEGG